MRKTLILLAALFPFTTAFAADCDTQVAFKPGESAASYQGEIRADGVCSYRFTAQKGQNVTVWLKGSGLDAILYGESSHFFENGSGKTLEKGGEQEIRVLQNRNAARKSSAPKAFSIRIAVTDK